MIAEAHDGPSALAAIRDHGPFDVVLLDQRLPGQSGVELMPEIREQLPQARIVMLTAYASLDLATSALARGASHFLAKPLTPALLRAAIAAAQPRGPEAGVGAAYWRARDDVERFRARAGDQGPRRARRRRHARLQRLAAAGRVDQGRRSAVRAGGVQALGPPRRGAGRAARRTGSPPRAGRPAVAGGPGARCRRPARRRGEPRSSCRRRCARSRPAAILAPARKGSDPVTFHRLRFSRPTTPRSTSSSSPGDRPSARPAPAASASGCGRRWCPSPTRRARRGSAPRARSPSD